MKMTSLKQESTIVPRRPTVLRFSPTAWAKLLFLRDAGDSEIGGFGIALVDDLLFVEDVRLIQQKCTWATVEFNDDSVANFFDEQVEAGRRPEEFARLWIHTHPGHSAEPSPTDEATFVRVFGRSDWAVLFILARGGQTYARLRYNVGPGADLKLSVEVDYGRPFTGSERELWHDEYLDSVHVPPPEPHTPIKVAKQTALSSREDELVADRWLDAWDEYVDFEHRHQGNFYGHIRDF